MKRSRPVRYLAYAMAFVLMLVEEGARGLRTGYDLWLAMVQQNEAGHRRAQERRKRMAQAMAGFCASWCANKPFLPPNTSQTIKFRRYSGITETLA